MASHTPIADIADWLHPISSTGRALVLLRAYFDESGTHGDASVTSLAGYVGTKDVWKSIEAEWKEVLSHFADKGVSWFHMSECLAQAGQFGRVDKDGVNFILTQLSKILGHHRVQPIASSVVNDHWHHVVTDAAFLRSFPTPLALCFDDLVRQLWEWAIRDVDGERVAPMFAYRTDLQAAALMNAYGSKEWYREALGPIAFDYPYRVIPLQAADLIAHQMTGDIHRRAYGPFDLAHMGQTVVMANAAPGRILGHWFEAESLKLTMKRFSETGEIYRDIPPDVPIGSRVRCSDGGGDVS